MFSDKDRGLVRIQAIGLLDGTAVEDLGIGDVLVWNYGYRERVTRIQETSQHFLTITLESTSLDRVGESSDRRMRKDRLVARVEQGGS